MLGSWVSACLVLARDIPLYRNKAGSLPGAWAQLVAALLLVAVGFSLAVRQLRRAVPLQEPWALGPLQPVGTPTGLACTTAAASSALQVSARSSSGEGWSHGPQSQDRPFLAAAMCSHLG